MLEFELVVPAYNEALSIRAIIEAAMKSAEEAGFKSGQFLLVVVENGSTDDSAKVLVELAKTELGGWFRVVKVHPNQGYGFGLASGLRSTTAPVVAWSHADMQSDPADAFKAYALVKESVRRKILVKGVRHGRNARDIFVSRVFETFARVLLGLRLHEINAQPKVFPRALLAELIDPPKTFAFDLYVLYRALRAGYEVKTIPVLFPPRVHGVSKWAATFFGRYKTILGMIRYMWELRGRERSS